MRKKSPEYLCIRIYFCTFARLICEYCFTAMDNYIVSARKYRPSTFDSVVGQRSLTDTLRNAIRTNHLAHAYLFCGPRGVGKTTCARIFAKTINCLNPTADFEACNECESCRAFNEQRSFNIHELDAASNNSVEDIRTLIQEVRIPPQIGKYSVYIIDEVHMLSQGAFNALLKTLEEPPSYAVFILATTEKHKVLPTILSRCQIYDFQRITVQDIVAHLQYVAAKEGVVAEEQALNVVARKADGGMRDALSIFDQLVAFCGNNITYQQTIEVLNVLDTDYYFRLVDAALRSDVTASLLLFNEVLQKGFDAGSFVIGLAEHLRDVLVSKDVQTLPLLQTAESVRAQYQQQAAACSAPWLFKALDILNTCDVQYRTARNKRLTVELALVKLSQLSVPAAQATPVPQPVAPKQAPSAPAQSAPIRPVSAPVQPVAPSRSVQQAPPARPSLPKIPSINLNTSSAPQAQPSVPVAPSAPQQNSPFSPDQLIGAWVGLKRNFPREERLLAMLSDFKPVIKGENTLQLALANPLQKEEFGHFEGQIMENLRRELKNDLIRLEIVVKEYKSDNRAYTAAEKYKQMVSDNPELLNLKTDLGLQLD